MNTLSPNTVRALMRKGMDTTEIATLTSCTEAECWNALGENCKPRLEPKQYADEAFAGMTRRHNILSKQREGRPVSVSQEQARQLQQTRRNVPVTLPNVSILSKEPAT